MERAGRRLLFSVAHVVRAVDQRAGSAALSRTAFGVLASVGGVALLVAAAAAATIAWSLAASRHLAPEGGAPEAR